MKRVGILGGMGPEAAIDLQLKILLATPAKTDEEHLPVVVCNIAQIPPRTPAILGHGESPLPAMAENLRMLEKMGAQIAAIACNTAHHWHSQLQAQVSIPLLHIADAVHEVLAQSKTKTVGLLSTPGTLASGFYQRRLTELGVSVRTPEAAMQEKLVLAIAAVKSRNYPAAAVLVEEVAQSLLDGGAEQLILGCTELPLVQAKLSFANLCIDATDALARQIVRICWHAQSGHKGVSAS